MKIFDDFFARVGAVDLTTAPEPETEVAEGDKVIGVLSEGLQRHYVVYSEEMDAIEQRANELKAITDAIGDKPDDEWTPEEMAHISELELLLSRRELLSGAFWHAVREELPNADIGRRRCIRKGWKIVWLPKERSMPNVSVHIIRL